MSSPVTTDSTTSQVDAWNDVSCLLHSGSCAIMYEKAIDGPVTEEHDYFGKTLELHNQCNVLVSLDNSDRCI